MATSPHLHACLPQTSQKGRSLTSPASYCPGSTAATPASPPSRPASQPAGCSPASPAPTQPRPAPPHGGPGWRLGVSLPAQPPSFPPSPSLLAFLPRPPLRQGPCKSRRGGTDKLDGVQLNALGSPLIPRPGWVSPTSWDLDLCELEWFPGQELASGRPTVPPFCIRTPPPRML